MMTCSPLQKTSLEILKHNTRHACSDSDRLHEECGVFGVAGSPDAAALTALGLHALQHRGQEAAGIVTFDGRHFNSERRLGLVGDHFSQSHVMDRLAGKYAIGHVRYSTFGKTVLRNIQPLFADIRGGGLACAHNGHLTNAISLRRALVKSGCIFQSTCDTEAILHLAAQSRIADPVDRLVDALRQIEGAYALVVLVNGMLVGARDPLGIRPLVLGRLKDAVILASESCALDVIGAEYVRDVAPGEIVIADGSSMRSLKPFPAMAERPCIFEYVYFARPDSILGGRNVYEYRHNMGIELAREAPVESDIVMPVPDSGVPAALGYASESGVPLQLGITRNHYVGRTFIEPTQQIRQLGVRLKHNPIGKIVHGKRVILIDDSIVRGNTAKKIVAMVHQAGAKEVHMRIACPPILYPDFYGIDTPNREELISNSHNEKELAKVLNVASLSFLSLDGLYRAMGEKKGRNAKRPQFTDHCFTGDYPTTLTDQKLDGHEKQISFLAEYA